MCGPRSGLATNGHPPSLCRRAAGNEICRGVAVVPIRIPVSTSIHRITQVRDEGPERKLQSIRAGVQFTMESTAAR
jgi:hypothetical protein